MVGQTSPSGSSSKTITVIQFPHFSQAMGRLLYSTLLVPFKDVISMKGTVKILSLSVRIAVPESKSYILL